MATLAQSAARFPSRRPVPPSLLPSSPSALSPFPVLFSRFLLKKRVSIENSPPPSTSSSAPAESAPMSRRVCWPPTVGFSRRTIGRPSPSPISESRPSSVWSWGGCFLLYHSWPRRTRGFCGRTR